MNKCAKSELGAEKSLDFQIIDLNHTCRLHGFYILHVRSGYRKFIATRLNRSRHIQPRTFHPLCLGIDQNINSVDHNPSLIPHSFTVVVLHVDGVQ
jgi:hypothetical protein